MKNGSKIFIICLTCSILLACSVKKTNNYIPLEEFSINNKPLDSICRSTISRIKLDTCESVLVLELICMDEAKYYYLSSQDKGLLMDCYICWNNRRIVGYTWFDKYLAIILSNVDNHYDFLDMFADDLDLQKGVAKFYSIIERSIAEVSNIENATLVIDTVSPHSNTFDEVSGIDNTAPFNGINVLLPS